MVSDKEFKKEFLKEISKDPDKYFATKILKEQGYKRGKCTTCGKYYWATQKRTTCEDASCSGGFRFFKNKPVKKPLTYEQTWNVFKKLFTKLGYTPIERYPVIARWRKDTDFVQASIYNFQPYVVSGEIDPPANPLVVPQFSLRFNDIDNVGLTMSHMTGFVMVGQHAFMPPKEFDQNKYFTDIHTWLTQGIGLPKEEIVYHEDAWVGGGNFGPCMEFFSRGVELGNQVYMLYERVEKGRAELPIKVLDMGMGLERVAWFTQGAGTIYDATFPKVMKKLFAQTQVPYDEKLIRTYLPHAAYLNVDEVDDAQEEWLRVAQDMNMDSDKLKELIMPLSALYSVAEHARTLLVALNDGGLPSNVGGGYNLRVILRRALGFIKRHSWNITLSELVAWHAEEIQELFPELTENLENVQKILVHETQKYEESKERNQRLIEKLIEKDNISIHKLIELYDSQGIPPEEIASAAYEKGKKILVPDNFYSLVAERHEEVEIKTATKKELGLNLKGLPATQALYYDHYDMIDFKAEILAIIDNYVILNQTAFYPTSGGQLNDTGFLAGIKVENVIKEATPQGTIILHKLKEVTTLSVGDYVEGKIDFERRLQLAQHHSATHLLTGAANRVLGSHVWQAGAAKTLEKSRLDITHYAALSVSEVKEIETVANAMVEKNIPIIKSFMPRDTAEKLYGFRLYQGGAVPGKKLRIVHIEGYDVEACGGTHLDVTGDIGHIKILKSSKIQDGVVRLEFVAGAAAEKALETERNILRDAQEILGGEKEQLPGRAQELFVAWKKAKKGKLKELILTSTQTYEGDLVEELATLLKTQTEHIIKTLKRFDDDIKRKLQEKK